MKQGLLYRGSEIDGAKNGSSYCLMPQGIVTMVTELGVITDMDFREETVANSVEPILGKYATRKVYNASQYTNVFTANRKMKTREIFRDLAKPESYPVYLYCTHGVDRAGTIVLLLEGECPKTTFLSITSCPDYTSGT